MATSADTIKIIIETMLTETPDDYASAVELLSRKGLLPKKMIEVKKEKKVSRFASAAAEDFAQSNDIDVTDIVGTGNGDKITVVDLKKHLKPKVKKANASSKALQFARDEGIDISEITGSGKNGAVKLEDVKKLVKAKKSESTDEDSDSDSGEELVFTPSAKKALKQNGLSEDDCVGIEGSGKNGAIMLSDIKELIDEAKEA